MHDAHVLPAVVLRLEQSSLRAIGDMSIVLFATMYYFGGVPIVLWIFGCANISILRLE